MEQVSAAAEHARTVFTRISYVDPILSAALDPTASSALASILSMRLVNRTFNEAIEDYCAVVWAGATSSRGCLINQRRTSKVPGPRYPDMWTDKFNRICALTHPRNHVAVVVHSTTATPGVVVAPPSLSSLSPSSSARGAAALRKPQQMNFYFGAFILQQVLRQQNFQAAVCWGTVPSAGVKKPASRQILERLVRAGNVTAVRVMVEHHRNLVASLLERRHDVPTSQSLLRVFLGNCIMDVNTASSVVTDGLQAIAASCGNPFAVDEQERDIVSMAVLSGSIETVDELVTVRAISNPRVFVFAVKNGDLPMLGYLLNDDLVSARCGYGMTEHDFRTEVSLAVEDALFFAVALNHLELVEQMLVPCDKEEEEEEEQEEEKGQNVTTKSNNNNGASVADGGSNSRPLLPPWFRKLVRRFAEDRGSVTNDRAIHPVHLASALSLEMTLLLLSAMKNPKHVHAARFDPIHDEWLPRFEQSAATIEDDQMRKKQQPAATKRMWKGDECTPLMIAVLAGRTSIVREFLCGDRGHRLPLDCITVRHAPSRATAYEFAIYANNEAVIRLFQRAGAAAGLSTGTLSAPSSAVNVEVSLEPSKWRTLQPEELPWRERFFGTSCTCCKLKRHGTDQKQMLLRWGRSPQADGEHDRDVNLTLFSAKELRSCPSLQQRYDAW